MKKVFPKIICIFLTVIMLEAYVPVGVFGGGDEITADYSISPDYAARYPKGVIELFESEISVNEGKETALKLIRMGGTEGRVSVELKAIDITAKFGTDYTVSVKNRKLKQSDEYTGTLTEIYLEESGGDYITADEILTDEVYKKIIGYDENANTLSDEEAAELREASIELVSDILKVSDEEAERIVDGTNKKKAAESGQDDTDAPYKSPLHELKDSILGEKTAPNGMVDTDLVDMESLIGNNDENLVASAVYDATVGASLRVVFEDGQNEKVIVIKALEDKEYDPEEIFSLGICNPEGGAEIGEIVGSTVVIEDNDETEPGTVGFASSFVTVGSDEICASVDIVREGCLNDFTEVRVATVSLNADAAKDYLPVDTTSVFLPGEKQKTLIVPLKTSTRDQTEVKEIGVVLDVEAGSAEADVSNTVIQILPRAALRGGATPVYDSDSTLKYFTIDVDSVKDSGSFAGLFNDLNGFYANMMGVKKIEVSFTVKRDSSSKPQTWSFLNKKDSYYFGIYGHPILVGEQVYDALPAVKLDQGESGTLTLGVREAWGEQKYTSWSTDQMSFKFYRSLGLPSFYRGASGMWPDELQRFMLKWKNNREYTVEELTWNDIEINEIRLYPLTLYNEAWADTDARNVKGEYREFNGTSAADIVRTVTYKAGNFDLPEWVYRGFDLSTIDYQITEAAASRKAFTVEYNVKGSGQVLKSCSDTLNANDIKTVVYDDTDPGIICYYISVIPVVRGAYIGSVAVEDYDPERGELRIGDKTYRNEDVASGEWREGDELFIFAYPSHGYKCDKIEITRADGTLEHIAPGEKVMLTKGMSVKPLFYEENIEITVSWKYPGSFIQYQNRATNMAGYAFTANCEYTDNGDGTYTFRNMTPGDIVTLYVLPENPDEKGFTRSRTGYWTRNAVEGEVRLNDDVRFVPCIGDIYAFEVDDHDMEFTFYLVDRAVDEGGTLVRGKVVTKGGTIKRPSFVDITAENVDVAGIPVAGANVAVLSSDPGEKITVNNVDYYTNATTDKNGCFTVYLPAYADNLGYCIAITMDDRIYQGVSIFTRNGTTVYVLPYQNPNYQIDRMTVGSDMDTTGIDITNNIIKLGIHAVIAPGYRAQKLVLRSYDCNGALFKEWIAEESDTEGWTYESAFVVSDKLTVNGTLTVELYDQKGRGLGEFDTGYSMKLKPGKGSVEFPDFDPLDSVTLPVLGEMTANFSFGSDYDVEPKEAQGSSSTALAGSSGSSGSKMKHFFTITYGSAGAIKKAVQATRKTPGYSEMSANERAIRILSHINNVADTGGKVIYKDPPTGTGTQTEGTGTSDAGTGTETGGTDTGGTDTGDTGTGDTGTGGGSTTDTGTGGEVPQTDPEGQPEPIGQSDPADPSNPETPADIAADDWEFIDGAEDNGGEMQNPPAIKAGNRKSDVVFTYSINVLLSFVVTDDQMYFDCLTMYADFKVQGSATREYTIWGVPTYIKFNGLAEGEFLFYGDAQSGKPIKLTGEWSYFNKTVQDQMESGSAFHLKIFFELGAGVGKLGLMTIGIAGSMVMDIDYQPWKNGAGIVSFNLDAEAVIMKVTARISMARASYGMFKTDGYTGLMDFSGVENASKFQNKKLLRSYRDARSDTKVYGDLENNPRGSSLLSGAYAMTSSGSTDPYNRILAEKKIENTVKALDPALVPIGDGSKVLYLRLDDDSRRGASDYSSVACSIIDWEGNETEPVYLDNDGTFDFNLKAAQIGGGRVLVLWSDLDRSFGNAEVENIGEMLNCADISYCIFDENGVPGEIKKLTSDYGFEGVPSIAYDEATGNVFVAYISTDYQTEGLTLTEDDLDRIGDFLYNSYSNVCFKVLDQNGEIVKDYTEKEAGYKAYESANGKGVLNGMRYLSTQSDRKVSQSTIREVSAAAVGGKAYVVYSVDTDRSVQTDKDRELLLVTCDLVTMEQSSPILLSDEETSDTNPQLIAYDGTVLMYWNQDGKLNCGDVVGYLSSTYDHSEYVANQAVYGVNNMGEIANAAASYFVTVQPDGNLCIVWIDWEETDEGNVPAVYFREYDPDYGTFKDDEGVDQPYGMWGNITKVASVEKDQDISEVAYIGVGRKMLISFKTVNKDDEGTVSSYDSNLMLLKGGNRQEISLKLNPSGLPLPGEKTDLSVTVKNLASLPSNKITVKVDLIDKDRNETPIGTKVFEDHFQSDDKVNAVFEDLVYPDAPDDYLLRVTSWDDDLCDYPVVNYFRLPYSAKIDYDSADLITKADGSFEFYVDVSNDGNKAYDGYIAVGYAVTEGEGDEKQTVYKSLTDAEELKLGVGETERKMLRFNVPDGLYDEDGVCELEVAVYANGEAAKTEKLYIYRTVKKAAQPEDILLNAENGKADIDAGETLALGGTIAPYDARNGYRIVYSVDDPSVASVDALGNVTALKEGTATVTVSVVKENTSLFITDSYRASSGGASLTLNEYGQPAGLMNVSGREDTVFSKTVEVNVIAHPPVPPTGDAGNPFALVPVIVITASLIAPCIFMQKKRKKNEG
ncbi:MAG: Ig-like domain-containing protein [Clostridia bacterium]|nr:Ig-like domain-containing protein [Clostridia bacterium]